MAGTIKCKDGRITVFNNQGALVLMEGVSQYLHPTSSTKTAGVLSLCLRAPAPASRHEVDLGSWACTSTQQAWLAAARCKLWWMTPEWGSVRDPIPTETQMLLVRLAMEPEAEQGTYVFILPLVTEHFRSSLSQNGSAIMFAAETGDVETQASEVDPALLLVAGVDPFETIHRGFAAAAELPGMNFILRGQKPVPASLGLFGWCTWDAFMNLAEYRSNVTPEGILEGVKGFAEGGVPARRIIIDDGWQTTGVDAQTEREVILDRTEACSPACTTGLVKIPVSRSQAEILSNNPCTESPHPIPPPSGLAHVLFERLYSAIAEGARTGSKRLACYQGLTQCLPSMYRKTLARQGPDQGKRLRSFQANRTFERPEDGISMKSLVAELKNELKVQSVFCWHHLVGYWCGLEPLSDHFADMELQCKEVFFTKGISGVEPSMEFSTFKTMQVGMPAGERGAAKLYDGLHGFLQDAGVDGVKVDGQSILSQVGQGQGGGPAVSRKYISALEASAQKHFGSASEVITCMSHANDAFFNYKQAAYCRVSDDFFPDDAASQACHICSCAFNGLFLSELFIADWDMFHSKHPSGEMHAAARAISGGPIYVSDRPGEHDFELLKQLATPDGELLLCDGPARPTRDCLFRDPQKDNKTVLKIFNTNSAEKLGVLGLFHIQGSSWDRSHRRFAMFQHREAPLHALARPRDVEAFRSAQLSAQSPATGEFAAFQRSKSEILLLPDGYHSIPLELGGDSATAQRFEVVTFSPVWQIPGHVDARFAAIGLEDMMNPGGAVKDMRALQGSVEVVGRGSGHFAFHADPPPRRCTLSAAAPADAAPADAPESAELVVRTRTCEGHLNGNKHATEHLTSLPLRYVVIPENWTTVTWALRFEW
ncbi:unnamed protein product [Effrenium voratum]|uniref:Raffinose synthase n=1 Tax=Effrenium voratum TaxID=2562239 RepID=A0AA36NIZ9_9DINO|nr:unnamed protein product [Effrenium voratum]CAJ1438344.1 unnamed protein product [Effrenium voratum]